MIKDNPTKSAQPIPYGRQHISEEDIQVVVEALKADYLTQGPRINEFEEQFAEYTGAKYAVAVSNGTAALHLCAMALGVEPGKKVITTPITFAASSNCVSYCGGEIVFADIDPATALLDIRKVRELLENNPRGTFDGIIPVDFTGYPVNLEEFRKLADEYDLWIIEDACHAPGGYFVDSKGRKQYCGNGQFADLAIFSFHPVKHIACGEGGMITTNNENLYEKLCMLRTHGITKDPDLMRENHGGWYYDMVSLGYNYRLTDFQAALGISQLGRADQGLAKRRAIAKYYNEAFENTAIKPMTPPAELGHAYHLYVILVEQRKDLYDFLRANQIFAQIHYIPTHTLSFYQGQGHSMGDMPHAEMYYSKCISLPMYPTLSREQQDYVIKTVLRFYNDQ